MKGLMFLIASFALLGCDASNETGASTSATADVRPAAQRPISGEEEALTTKFKASVFDIGGQQALKAEGCALTVYFGGNGTGTDTTMERQIKQLLEDDPTVVEVQRFVIGREGENLLCIHLDPEGDADRLFDELQAKASNAYQVRISSESGRKFHSSRKRK